MFCVLLVCFLLVFGIGLRLWYALLSEYNINCDTSTMGIMALHVLNGEIPLFFYGQEYLGPFEAIIIAVFFKIFGISNYAMFYGMIFLSIFFLISAYLLSKYFGGESAGIIALALCSIAPPYLIQDSVLPFGYHIEMLFMGNMLFLLTFRLVQKKNLIYCILIGIISGFAFWTHYIIVYYLVPIALYIAMNVKWRELIRFGAWGMLCFFLGALPFWIYTLTHDFGTFGFPPSEKGDFISAIKETFFPNFSILFGLKMPFFTAGHYVDMFIFLVYTASFIYFAYKTLNSRQHIIMVFLFMAILVFLGIYNYHARKGCAYYILPLYSLIPVVVGYAISRMKGKYMFFGIGIVLFIVTHNLIGIHDFIMSEKKDLVFGSAYFPKYIDFLRKNKINRIICGNSSDYIIQFYTKEDIVISGCGGSEYLPYDFQVESADKIGIAGSNGITIDAVCKSYKYDYDIFYDVHPFDFAMEEILPDKWRANSNYSKQSLPYAFDRNYDKWWSSAAPRKTGMFFTIDLGGKHTICKIQIFNKDHLYNFPITCRIEASVDGDNWKEVKFVRNVEPLFWSGPRLYWHLVFGRWEVLFNPVPARYIRLVQEGDGIPHPWEINEIFVYEYKGDKGLKTKDYIKDAKNILRFIKSKEFNFVYADFWLSAKLKLYSKGTIETLNAYNGNAAGFDRDKNISRIVKIKPETVFVIDKMYEQGFEEIIKEFQFPIKKKRFGHFICYYFSSWDNTYLKQLKDESWLYWIGIGAIKNNLKEYSSVLMRYALLLQNEGKDREALAYLEKSIRYYSNNNLSYKLLAELYKKLELTNKYNKCLKIIQHKFIPRIKRCIIFKNNVGFIGLTMNNAAYKKGDIIKIDYFWRVYGKAVPSNLDVFVYFIKDGAICFQNDHAFLAKYSGMMRVFDDEIFRESFRIGIPKDVPAGEYKIYIGLWQSDIKKRIYSNKSRESKFMVAKITIRE